LRHPVLSGFTEIIKWVMEGVEAARGSTIVSFRNQTENYAAFPLD